MVKIKHDDVIVLHDSGKTLGAGKDAPAYMLQALREVLEETLERGFANIRLDEHIS